MKQFLLPLLAALSFGVSSVAHADELSDWVRPLIGNHSLPCGSVSIRDLGGYYSLDVNGKSAFLLGDASISTSERRLSYSHVTSSGVFGCGQKNKDIVVMTKNSKGELQSVHLTAKIGSGCIAINYQTIADVKCAASADSQL